MFNFKTRAPLILPKVEEIQDQATKMFGQDLGKLLSEFMRSLLDDLKMVEKIEKRDALPTADADQVGKLYLLEGTGSAADVLYFCIDTGSGGYAYKTVGLT